MSRPPFSEQQKRELIRDYAIQRKIHIFVETGTQMGLMVDYVKDIFDKIYTVEILKNYYDDAVNKFKDNKNINLFLGDSAIVLGQIMVQVGKLQPSLFWLDAHNYTYSPALKELEVIFKRGVNDNSLILIDDMRNFDKGRKDYPTKKQLEDIVRVNKPKWQVLIVKDVMRIGNSLE